MSKVKSAIITAILVAAIIVASLFAVISFPVAGSDGVQRIDSIASRITLGGELSGEAYRIIYPDGVIPKAQYERGLPEKPAAGDPEEADKQKKYDDYCIKYVDCGNFYIESELVGIPEGDSYQKADGSDNAKADDKKLADFRSAVKADADILASRFDKRDFLTCTIAVVDEVALRVSVPTGYNGAAYRNDDFSSSSGTSAAATRISSSIQFLTLGGELSLRNNASGNNKNDDGAGILSGVNEDVSSWFKGISAVTRGGTSSIKMDLTDEGYSRLSKIVSDINSDDDVSDKNILFYVGENLLLTLGVEGSGLPGQSFYIQISDSDTAQNYETIFNSVIGGQILKYDYNESNTSIIYATSELGRNSALLFGITALIIVVAAAAFPFIRYKRLAIVNALSVLGYSLVMLYAIYLLGITVTFAGLTFAILGLGLLTFSNIRAFESVREETKKGKTMQASVKSGYRGVLSSLLDLHILLLLASIILALVPVGEAAACGFIFFIGVLASYAFHWITRFMWYVISSPVRDKFKFGGYKREVGDDD